MCPPNRFSGIIADHGEAAFEPLASRFRDVHEKHMRAGGTCSRRDAKVRSRMPRPLLYIQAMLWPQLR